jgi:hypothetical protein
MITGTEKYPVIESRNFIEQRHSTTDEERVG